MKGVPMLPGDLNPHAMLRGFAILQENEESTIELLPPITIRQRMANALNHLSHLTGKNRSTLSREVVALAKANQATEARVVELERRLAALIIEVG